MPSLTSLDTAPAAARQLAARILGPRIVDAWTFAPEDSDEIDVRGEACTISTDLLPEPEKSQFRRSFGTDEVVAFDPLEVSAYRPLRSSSTLYVYINEHRYLIDGLKDVVLPYKKRGAETAEWEFCEVALGKGGVQRIPVLKRARVS